jgi:uncharacterized protein (DUF2141 family)
MTLAVSLVAGLLTWGVAAPAQAASEAEPNDTVAAATAIGVNDPVSGKLGTSSDEDYFTFTTTQAGVVSLTFTHPNLTVNENSWQVFLINDQSTTIDSVLSSQNQPSVATSQVGLPAGTYYAHVKRPNYRDHSDAVYQLTANFSASSDWETEYNDTVATADALVTNTAISGTLHDDSDVDYYVFTTPSAGVVSLTFTHANLTVSENSWQVFLINSQSTTVDSVVSSQNDPAVATSQVGLPAGTYFVKVERPTYRDLADAPYQLTANFVAATDWETEYNDTFATANTIAANTQVTGTLHDDADVDYFSFTTPSAGVVQLAFAHANLTVSENSWQVLLINDQSVTIDSVLSSQNDPSVTTSQVGLPAGTYFVKVERPTYRDLADAPYQLTAAFTATSTWETEFNDDYPTADPIALAKAVNGTLDDSDDVDYYRVSVPKAITLAVMLEHTKFASTENSWEVSIIDSRSQSLATVTSGQNQPRVVVTAKVKAGTYYVKVARPTYRDLSDVPYKVTAGKALKPTFNPAYGK